MSFYGTEFVFDGTSSYEFGLCLYSSFDNASQGNTEFAANVAMKEDRPFRRSSSYCYGGAMEGTLTFTLVFGVSEERKEISGHYDRAEMQKIASWLTGHREYKWLQIVQDDLTSVRYRCYITDLKAVEVGGIHWGFECTVICDSPYGYLTPQEFTYEVDGSRTVVLHSDSSANEPYPPLLSIKPNSCTTFTIKNLTDSNREFTLNGVPTGCGTITLDCGHGVLSCESGINLYSCCNFKFPRLIRGDNQIVLTGSGTYIFTCEYPINVGS